LPCTIAPNGIHSHLQQYVVNPYGNETTGVLSPYCICIGDKSSLSYTDNGKFYFDKRKLEICLTEVPSKFPLADIGNNPLADIGNNNEENGFVEDFDPRVSLTLPTYRRGAIVCRTVPGNPGRGLESAEAFLSPTRVESQQFDRPPKIFLCLPG